VVAAAGNLTHDRVVDRLAGHSEALEVGPDIDLGRSVEGLAPAMPRAVLTKPVEQVHVVMGMRGIAREDPDRYALTVLNQALGGGMSSRLFQEVRERRGIAYAVYSYRVAYVETGAFGVYAGTAPGRASETIDVVGTELDRVIRDAGIGGDELTDAKSHLKGSMALSLETSNSRMHRLGSSELMLGEALSLDEIAARVDAVTPDDVARIVDRLFSSRARTLAVVGPVDEANVPVPG
jgi:predicted Zn-dependent peptidase